MSHDDDIEKLYRTGSAEQPGAAADAAMLALARAAAEESRATGAVAQSRRSGAPARPTAQASPLRRWRAPIGLAASLVLAVGIVSRVQIEEEAGNAPGAAVPATSPVVTSAKPAASSAAAPPPAAPAAPAEPAAGASRAGPLGEARKSATDSASAPERTAVPKKADVLADAPQAFPAPAPGAAAPAQNTAKPEARELRKALADSVGVASESSARKESAPAPREAEELKRAQPALAASAGGAATSVAAAPPAPASSAVPGPAAASSPMARAAAPTGLGEARRDDAARMRAAGDPPDMTPSPDAAALSESSEATLTPEQWLRRIIDARRAGRDDEADASLKRFVARHPAQAVPPEARRATQR